MFRFRFWVFPIVLSYCCLLYNLKWTQFSANWLELSAHRSLCLTGSIRLFGMPLLFSFFLFFLNYCLACYMCCIPYTFCSYMYCYVNLEHDPKCHICLYDTPKSVFARLPACHFLSRCSVCEDFPGKHELPINTSDASQHQRLD